MCIRDSIYLAAIAGIDQSLYEAATIDGCNRWQKIWYLSLIHILLSGERVALNLLQRMSGIATCAREMAAALQGTNTRLLDTRKTTPGLRILEKYAVRVGGG